VEEDRHASRQRRIKGIEEQNRQEQKEQKQKKKKEWQCEKQEE
jgi:hypothetical protein